MRERQEGHGWWPYLVPYVAFTLAVTVSSRLPAAWGPWLLAVKPAIPAALIVYFHRRGCYPELRSIRWQPGWMLLDVLVGIVLAVQWMGPYLVVEALPRPPSEDGFDPMMAGESMVGMMLALRFVGFAMVTPLFEELFIRSFVIRVADVYADRGDFRNVPIGHYSRVSFVASVVIFTIGHQFWEYPVAVVWVALTNLWFYLRKDLGSVILLHATTNATILLYVILATGGTPGSPLWVFI